MLEIVFANPNLLYLLIPFIVLLILVLIISIRKRKLDYKTISSFIIHVIITICIVFSVSDMKVSHAYTASNAEIIALADLSFSNSDNTQKIDEVILNLQNDLDEKTTLGVVGFGKDYELISPFGSKFTSVANNSIDSSATDIARALNYADTLFSSNAIKKVVIISDGKQTDGDCVYAAEQLIRKNVRVDVVDFNNPTELSDEIQVNGVSYTKSVFKGNNEDAAISIQSNFDDSIDFTLYKNNDIYLTGLIDVTEGLNVYRFALDTSTNGEILYRVKINSQRDTFNGNNEIIFAQTVTNEINVLVIGGKQANNYQFFADIYTNNATLEFFDYENPIALDLENLAKFDEIILDNFNIDDISNPDKFASDLDSFVSLYGKSVMTFGDLVASTENNEALQKLEKILPVRFRPSNDSRVVVLVIDCSLSMATDNRLQKAKDGAIRCLDSLSEDDYVMIQSFCQNVKIVQPITRVANKEKIIEAINTIEIDYGTHIGFALNETYNQMQNLDFDSKRVVLLSDGEPTEGDMDSLEVTKEMSNAGIFTSVLNISCPGGESLMRQIAINGNGSYYFVISAEDIGDIMTSEIEDEYLDKVIEGTTNINIDDAENSIMTSVDALPDINGYYYSRAKGTAKIIASTNYVNEAGGQRKCPIYASWKYGRGNVSTFTSRLDNDWASKWKTDAAARIMMKNASNAMRPKSKITTSLNINFENNGYTSKVSVGVVDVKDNSNVEVTVIFPNGNSETKTLTIVQSLYVGTFETPTQGTYQVIIKYGNDIDYYEINDYITFSYSSEYDLFDNRSSALLYKMVGESGKVYKVDEKVDPIVFETYTSTKDLLIYLLVGSVVLFILEILIRKINITVRRKKHE